MIVYKNAFPAQALSGGDNVAYVVPDGVVSSVRALTVHNPSANMVTVEVFINDVQMIKKTLAENQSYLCPELANHVLHGGTKISIWGQGVNAMLSVAEQVL